MNIMGQLTHATRVDQWQCDFNAHWNLRYFCDSIQAAAETIGTKPRQTTLGAGAISARHMRVHKELFTNTPVTVYSLRLKTSLPGQSAGAPTVVHLLYGGKDLAATAIDEISTDASALPEVDLATLPLAKPRGILSPPPEDLTPLTAPKVTLPLGPIRPHDLDHTGFIGYGALIRLLAIGTNDYHYRLGFTPAELTQNHISRMTLETWARFGTLGRAGHLLEVTSTLITTGAKTFTTRHQIREVGGAPLITFEQCLAAVDLRSRRAIALPAFFNPNFDLASPASS